MKELLDKNGMDGDFQKEVWETLDKGRQKQRNLCLLGNTNMAKGQMGQWSLAGRQQRRIKSFHSGHTTRNNKCQDHQKKRLHRRPMELGRVQQIAGKSMATDPRETWHRNDLQHRG